MKILCCYYCGNKNCRTKSYIDLKLRWYVSCDTCNYEGAVVPNKAHAIYIHNKISALVTQSLSYSFNDFFREREQLKHMKKEKLKETMREA